MASLDQFKSQIDLLSLDINNLDDNARAELLKHLAQKIGTLSQKKETVTPTIKSERDDEINSKTDIKKENKVIKKEFNDGAGSSVDNSKKEPKEDNSKDASLAKLYNGKLPTCKECKESFRSLGALDDHVGTVHKEKEKSKVDNQNPTNKVMLEKQQKPGKFECKGCDKVFENHKNLRRHSIIHTDRFQCKSCGKRCLQHSDLLIHNRSPLSCKKYLDSVKRSEEEKNKSDIPPTSKVQQRNLRNRSIKLETKPDNGEKEGSKVEDSLPRLRDRSTKAEKNNDKEEKKEEYSRFRRILPKPSEEVEKEAGNDPKQKDVNSISSPAAANTSELINSPKEKNNTKEKVYSKTGPSSKDKQFCKVCDVKVGGNSNNYRLHVGGAVHQELTLQEGLGMDPRQFLCRVCQRPSRSYKAFQTHLRMHPGGAVTEGASEIPNVDTEAANEKMNVDSDQANLPEEKVLSEKKFDDSDHEKMIESEVDEESDSFETNPDDEPCSEKSSEDEKLMESEDDNEEESNNKMLDDKIIGSKESSLMESEEDFIGGNITEGDEEDSRMFEDINDQSMSRINKENVREEGTDILSDQTLDSNGDDGSDESEIELDDAELLDDEEIEEFQNHSYPVTSNESEDVEETDEEMDGFTELDQEIPKSTVDDMEMDEDDDEEEMRQCEQCHKYFPDEIMLTDHMRTHVQAVEDDGEEENDPSKTVVKEVGNTYRSSLIPDFILDTLR